MRICRLSPALALFLAHAGIAQTTPDPVVLHAGTHVVLVNVVAQDKHGKPVNDLKRDDFVLRDNGQQQKIGLFALEEAGGASVQRSNFPAQLTFTNRPGAAGVTVFLFDELNTQLADQELARNDFVRYLRELPPASRVAVFVLGDSLSLLHDFSQDMASLIAALSKHANRINPEVTASTAPPASSNSLTGDQTTTAQWDAFMKSSSQAYVNYTQTVRATRTAAALETIAGHLQGIPGRKTLIWISGGFPIQLGLHNKVDTIPDSNSSAREDSHGSGRRNGQGSEIGAVSNGASGNSNRSNSSSSSSSSLSSGELPGTGTSFADDVARAIRALNEADVAVYPVNARGVTVAGPYQADRSSMGKRNGHPKANFTPDFDDETLQTLAVETGGRAFHHINDLGSAFEQAADDAKVSYSLTFSPAASSLDGSYHRLELTVNRSGVKLRYRPGYVAAPDRAVAPSLADAIANPVDLAGIGFTVHLDKVEEGYKASVVIDPHSVTLEPKGGKWIGSLQFIVVVGKVVQLTTIPLNFTEALYRRVQDEGLQMGAQVKTSPGTTGFSLGFRDIPSGLVGTLHVRL
jgi:VWFA-related protein